MMQMSINPFCAIAAEVSGKAGTQTFRCLTAGGVLLRLVWLSSAFVCIEQGGAWLPCRRHCG